jgi:hypothetical protein
VALQVALVLLLGFQMVSVRHHESPAAGEIPNNQSYPSLSVDASPQANEGIEPAKKTSSSSRKKQSRPVQTFTGTVEWEYKPLAWDCDVPNCDHFALYDDATRSNFEIDDARAALPYEGKRAKLTGVVDLKNKVIHLVSIEPLN